MSFKSARLSKGLTLKQAADAIGITAQAISLWENNQTMPSAALLPKIASVYETTIDRLFERDEKETV